MKIENQKKIKMKYLEKRPPPMNYRLEVGERLKCGEVFVKNVDGYTSSCAVECQLCEDRSICSLTEFMEHLEIWHSDWENDLQHDDEMHNRDRGEVGTATAEEVIQPFEKVLIVTDRAKQSSKLGFSESAEEEEEISEIPITKPNRSTDIGLPNSNSDGSQEVVHIVDVARILSSKSETTSLEDNEECSNDKSSRPSPKSETSSETAQNEDNSHRPKDCSDQFELNSLKELDCQASPLSSGHAASTDISNDVEECNKSAKKGNIIKSAKNDDDNYNDNYDSSDEDDDGDEDSDDSDDDQDDDDHDHDDYHDDDVVVVNDNKKNRNDRSEDSGVEKSDDVGSLTASMSQNLTSEDEQKIEQKRRIVHEHVRIAMNETRQKPKLTNFHFEKLLKLYEAHPRLWLKSHPEYNHSKLCRKSWKEIKRIFNRSCKQKLKKRDIRVRISTLCYRYLKERTRRQIAHEFNEPKVESTSPRFKYFDKMKFLDANQRAPYQEQVTRLHHEHQKLLEIYSHFPILWTNTDNNKQAENVEKREKAYNDISIALQLMGIYIPAKLVRQRIMTLRKRYRLEKMRHLHCELQGKPFETGFKQYESMKFLDRYIAPYVCDTCGKIFRKLPEYQNHLATKKHEVFKENSESNSMQECETLDTAYSADDVPMIGEDQVQNLLINNPDFQQCGPALYFAINNDNISAIPEPIGLNSNPSENIGNFINESSFVQLSTNNFDQTNEKILQNFYEVPSYVIQNVESGVDIGAYLNNAQIFTLQRTNTSEEMPLPVPMPIPATVITTTAHNERVVETSDSQNSIQIPLTALPMKETLETTVDDISPNEVPFVPISLIADETMNNVHEQAVIPPPIPPITENISIADQYFTNDGGLTVQITPSLDAAAAATKSDENTHNDQVNSTTNLNQLNSMPATSYDETENLFNSGSSDKCVENFLSGNQFIGMNSDEFNHLTTDGMMPVECQLNETFSTMSDSESLNNDSLENIRRIRCEIEMEADTISRMASEESSMKSTPTPTNEEEDEEMKAKIECGGVEFEVELSKRPEHERQEQSLLGRLPREHTIEIIEGYRNFPELWHPEHEHYTSRHVRRAAWKAMTKRINKNLNKNFNWMQVQRKIVDYIKYYRHERRRIQNKNGCTQWVFYDNFKFLDEVLMPPSEDEKRKQQRFTILKIIDVYKEHPQMWNTTHLDYSNRYQRRCAVSEMVSRLQEIHNITIEGSKLKQRIVDLRKEYRIVKHARNQAEKKNEPFDPQKQFEFYDELYFLEDHVPPFGCRECKLEFRCYSEYSFHMKKDHKDHELTQKALLAAEIAKNCTDNVCHVCGIKFTLRHNLLQHVNRHYVGRTLPCSTCDKKFYTKNSLREHERIHTREPAVICDLCGKTFVNKSKLTQHMKRHKNQRDHKCEKCGKLFYTAFDRDRHFRRHLKIRDKICPVCGKDFLSGSTFYAHMKLHNDKKEYVCNTCGKEFAQYAGLYKHRKRYHPEM